MLISIFFKGKCKLKVRIWKIYNIFKLIFYLTKTPSKDSVIFLAGNVVVKALSLLFIFYIL